MKIYLTEMEQHGKKFAGPNIVAETLQEAEEAAEANGLTLLGEFVEIVTEDGLMHYLEPEGYNKEKGVTLIEFCCLCYWLLYQLLCCKLFKCEYLLCRRKRQPRKRKAQ